MHRTSAIDLRLGLLGAALLACAFAFALFGIPRLPPAPMALLGIPSPLTGMTRSFVALAQGHFAHALALHPLGPLCFGACILAVVNLVVRTRSGRRLTFVDRIVRVPYGVPITAAAFAVAWVRQIVTFR